MLEEENCHFRDCVRYKVSYLQSCARTRVRLCRDGRMDGWMDFRVLVHSDGGWYI